MKVIAIIATAAVLTANSLAQGAGIALSSSAVIRKIDGLPTATEATEAARKIDLPAGIKLTGSTEPIRMPASKSKEAKDDATVMDATHEQFFGGLGGWGGWGGFGPYRFGYTCGGLGGWAYPLGYWNTFGAGLWGGGCGLGLAYGGLFYC